MRERIGLEGELPDRADTAAVKAVEQAPAGYPEFDAAIASKRATFSQVLEAHYYRTNADNEPARTAYEAYLPHLWQAFNAAYGTPLYFYTTTHTPAGAVLTDRGEFEIITPPLKARVSELTFWLDEARALVTSVRANVEGPERFTALELIYSAVTGTLDTMDALTDPTDPLGRTTDEGKELLSRALAYQRRDYQRAADFYLRAARRAAVTNYIVGMAVGFVVVLLVGLAVGFGVPMAGRLLWGESIGGAARSTIEILVVCILLGGVGSVVSVMTRLTGQHLELDHDAGTWQLRLLGGFRPVIGAVFGIVLFFIVGSGLIPIEEPIAPTDVVLFYGSLAFLAGFSERFAQDMLVATTQRVTTISGQTPPAAGTGQDELSDAELAPPDLPMPSDTVGRGLPPPSEPAVADTADVSDAAAPIDEGLGQEAVAPASGDGQTPQPDRKARARKP